MFSPGQNVNGYEIIGPVSGGKSQSWRAVRDRDLYFLKLLPRPKYPRQKKKPTPDRYRQMLEVCADFERRNHELMAALADPIVGGGNLVKPVGFFRQGSCYLKSYLFISGESSRALAGPTVARDDLIIFVRTLLLCLRELHTHGIVHGDLKPENVIIERRAAGPVARLIDFDEAYLSGRPPPSAQSPGSEDYYSPELVTYRRDEVGPAALTTGADIFALGLVIHVVLTGRFPTATGGHGETAAEVVATGGRLIFEPLGLGAAEFEATLSGTAASRPTDRPTIDQLLSSIGVKIARLPPPPQSEPRPPTPAATGDPPSRVVSTMGRRRADTAATTIREGAP